MATESPTSSTGGFLGGLRGILSGANKDNAADSANSDFAAVRDEFNSTLKSLRDKAAAQRAALERRKLDRQKPEAPKHSAAEVQRAQLKAAYDEALLAMRSEIESLHTQLKTGVDPASLAKQRETLLSIAETAAIQGGDIESRLRSAAIIAVVKRSAELAWDRLSDRMNSANVQWPDPHHLLEGASDEQMAIERERSIAEVRETFLNTTPQAVAELVIGVVPAWTVSYPPNGSWLWKKVALRGVGAGIQAQIVNQVFEGIKSEGEAIRQEVSSLLAKELASLETLAKRGAAIEEIDQLVRSTSEALEGIVVEMVLTRAEPLFEKALQA